MYLSGHRLHLWFNDGTEGEVDLAQQLDGPIFAPLRQADYFRQFQLAGHTVTWPNGADFAPEYLHELVQASTTAR
ncbi:DUF2442 domain-containing protein [Anatilimnocola sp. NA78]|uniref:DUF2442 domain-containing protein n=1 Tax=Anatilimnocola sp. NA78 TaxID=3415683 RepID=UPI003CE4B85C